MTAALIHETERTSAHPFYIEGTKGPLFCNHFLPAPGLEPRGSLLYLGPFAEEANRSRRMAVVQARRLAGRGWPVMLLDPYGTGDSAGEFHEARWEVWLEDAALAARWLAARWPEGSVTLWGLRLGALLAAALAGTEPKQFGRLVFWQPLLRGDRFMAQFLRLRVAAAMAVGEKETGQLLRERLAAGEILEVAGYELAPDLVSAIESLRLEAMLEPLGDHEIDWIELSAAENGPSMTAPTQRLLEAITASRFPQLTMRAVAGEPFWNIEESTLAPNLLDATDAFFD